MALAKSQRSHGLDKSGEPNLNLVHKGKKQLVNVIYLTKALSSSEYSRLRLLNEKQLEQVDKYLNNPKRGKNEKYIERYS